MSTKEEISPVSVLLEPLIVASLLTAGCLLTRRTSSQLKAASLAVPRSLLASDKRKPFLFFWSVPVPDTTQFRDRFASRFLARFPFLIEVWYWLLTYWVYQIGRAISALTLVSETTAIARSHGIFLLNVEQSLRLNPELGLQAYFIAHPTLMSWTNKVYSYVHIPATIAFMGYFFGTAPGAIFRRTRRTLVMSNLLAFVIFSSWPCMPPRLLPEEYGFVDTVHKGRNASAWTTNKFQNQLAAMPSLHFGYSLIIGLSLFFLPSHLPKGSLSRPQRIFSRLALLYPLMILITIMATANHYFLDAAAGACVALTASSRFVNRGIILGGGRAVEEWGFWLVGMEKPLEKEQFDQLLVGANGSPTASPLMRQAYEA